MVEYHSVITALSGSGLTSRSMLKQTAGFRHDAAYMREGGSGRHNAEPW